MTLIWLTVNGEYAHQLSDDLIAAGYSTTEIASTGDFLHYGNTILLLCIEQQRVEELINYIKMKMQEYRHSLHNAPTETDFSLYSIPLSDYQKINGRVLSKTISADENE